MCFPTAHVFDLVLRTGRVKTGTAWRYSQTASPSLLLKPLAEGGRPLFCPCSRLILGPLALTRGATAALRHLEGSPALSVLAAK